MIRILCILAGSAASMIAASCCCTSDMKPPGLRPLPQFQEIQPEQPAHQPAPQIHRGK